MAARTPVPNSSLKNRAELLKTLGVLVLVLGVVSASIVFWSGQKRSSSQSNSQETSVVDGGGKKGRLWSKDLRGSFARMKLITGKVQFFLWTCCIGGSS